MSPIFLTSRCAEEVVENMRRPPMKGEAVLLLNPVEKERRWPLAKAADPEVAALTASLVWVSKNCETTFSIVPTSFKPFQKSVLPFFVKEPSALSKCQPLLASFSSTIQVKAG